MRPDELTWETTANPPPPDAAVIDESLEAFNHGAADLGAVRPLACFARLPSGRLVGGALARTWGRCCELRQLWVEEAHRRLGVGSRLVRLVEEQARARGCTLLFLETFSFQAPALYHRLGYETVWRIEGFPDDITKFILRKELC